MVDRVLVLGAGFGGLEVAATLSERLGDAVDVTLIDRNDAFVFGFAKLDVMFGSRTAQSVRHAYSGIRKPGVRFVQGEIQAIDAAARRVQTSVGTLEADHLVIALGADVDPSRVPGMADVPEYYSTEGAFALRETLAAFDGGRVVVGVAGPVFKCPPAPSETAILVHDHLVALGVRERSGIELVMPLPAPVPPVPDASSGLLRAFAERGIGWHPSRTMSRIDTAARRVVFDDGDTLRYDLFLGVPVHVAPAVVRDAGLAPDGWIAVDHETFRTAYPGVYAIGDVAATGTPKAGVFAAGQGAVVAAEIAAEAGAPRDVPAYDGAGVCYVGFGGPTAAKVDVVFAPGQAPRGSFEQATVDIAGQKEAYRTQTARRWFGA